MMEQGIEQDEGLNGKQQEKLDERNPESILEMKL